MCGSDSQLFTTVAKTDGDKKRGQEGGEMPISYRALLLTGQNRLKKRASNSRWKLSIPSVEWSGKSPNQLGLVVLWCVAMLCVGKSG